MSDPKIVKYESTLKIEVKHEDSEAPIIFSKLVAKETKDIPQDQLSRQIDEELSKISLKSGAELYRISTFFSYENKDALRGFNFGNILVQAHLPYCLKIPDFMEIEVNIPESGISALVTTEKIWTNRAHSDQEKSDDVDLFADDIPLFFKNSTMLSPKFPFNPDEGWDSHLTGRNVEIVDDKNGVFRFTRIHIQLRMNTSESFEKLKEKSQEALIDEICSKSLLVTNRIIENYRESTGEDYIRKLSHLKINLVYFIKENIGLYHLQLNIRPAMINRPLSEIREIIRNSKEGKTPALYKMLLLNAKNSLKTMDFTLAIVESFQALEIFLENYLITAFKKRGDKESEYSRVLSKHWKTKDRLNKVLKNLTNTSLNTQTELWNKWCLKYDKTRNEVIHSAKDVTKKETEETLKYNEEVINWLSSL